ncbi:putative glutamate receptor-like isoform X2, partial [Leptotrombidium deliense]
MKYLLVLAALSTCMIVNSCSASAPILRVTTILNEPYIVLRGDHKRITNRSEITGDLLDGYLIDLLRSLSDYVKFDYKIHLVKDSAYGTIQNSKNWNGMIGEVLRN